MSGRGWRWLELHVRKLEPGSRNASLSTQGFKELKGLRAMYVGTFDSRGPFDGKVHVRQIV